MCNFKKHGFECGASATIPNPAIPASLNVCERHFEMIAGAIRDANPLLGNDEINDYTKIHCIVQNKTLMNDALVDLSKLLSTFAAKYRTFILISYDVFPPPHWLLKSVEEHYGFEKDCVMTGLLSAEAFLEYLGGNYNALDFGAGADHGAFTHRLQWFAVMWVASGGKLDGSQQRDWITPLADLWAGLGEAKTRNRVILEQAGRGGEAGTGLWAAMFDKGGGGNYSHPDSMHAAIRSGNLGGTSLKDSILRVQQDVVNRQVTVLDQMLKKGTAQFGPRIQREGQATLTERADLLEAATTGGVLALDFRFKRSRGFFKASEFVGSTQLSGSDQAGPRFVDIIQTGGLKLLIQDLQKNRQWIMAQENLMTRTDPVKINDYL